MGNDTTNIRDADKALFDALRNPRDPNFALFSAFLNGEPCSVIIYVEPEDGAYKVTPVAVLLSAGREKIQNMLTDHDGVPPLTEEEHREVNK